MPCKLCTKNVPFESSGLLQNKFVFDCFGWKKRFQKFKTCGYYLKNKYFSDVLIDTCLIMTIDSENDNNKMFDIIDMLI